MTDLNAEATEAKTPTTLAKTHEKLLQRAVTTGEKARVAQRTLAQFEDIFQEFIFAPEEETL